MRNTYIENLRLGLSTILEDPNVILLGEDVEEPYGGAFKVTKGLSSQYPGRVLNMPMSEQGFTGMATGMALAGMKPVVEIMFGDFITLIMDQIVNHASKFCWLYDTDMHIVIRAPMGGYRGYGATHSQSLEKLLFGLPDIYVVAPSIATEPGKLLNASVELGKPVLFIENKSDYSSRLLLAIDENHIIKNDNSAFPYSTIYYGETESDITIITYGGLVKKAAQLQRELYMEEEIGSKIIAPSLLSPLNFNDLYQMVENDEDILILEEGHSPFGWGDAVVSQLVQRGFKKRIETIGSRNSVIGSAKELEEYVLPNFAEIKNTLIERVG